MIIIEIETITLEKMKKLNEICLIVFAQLTCLVMPLKNTLEALHVIRKLHVDVKVSFIEVWHGEEGSRTVSQLEEVLVQTLVRYDFVRGIVDAETELEVSDVASG